MSSEYAFLYVEDDEDMIEAMDTSINLMKRSEEYIFYMKVVNSSDEAIRALDNDVFDFVLIDIKLSGEDSGDTVIEKIKKDYKIPCAILSGTPDVTDNDLIKVYKKSEISNEDVLKQMASEVDSGLFKVIGERGLLEENLKDLF
jgi:response regulator receiver domain